VASGFCEEEITWYSSHSCGAVVLTEAALLQGLKDDFLFFRGIGSIAALSLERDLYAGEPELACSSIRAAEAALNVSAHGRACRKL